MPSPYPAEFHDQVLLDYQKGRTISEICQCYQIAPSTVYHWVKIGGSALNRTTATDFKSLQRKYDRLEHLLQIIDLSELIDQVPLRRRLEILAQLHQQEQFNIHELCDALHVARGTFYNHIFRRADRTRYLEEQETLKLQIQQIFDSSKQRYGAEKIRAALAESGVRVGKERIRQIMVELGLESSRKEAKQNYKKFLKRNLLRQNFKTEHKNEVWVSDVTYFKVKDCPFYLCIILDLFSRRVVAYHISKTNSTHLVTTTFRKSFADRGNPKGLVFHSDRGTQYTSRTFETLLRQSGVTQSFSRPGCPFDNAVSETFFATFKKEEAYRRHYISEQDFRQSVDEYIYFYNEVRPHQTLAYKSPVRFEELYGSNTVSEKAAV